MFIQQYYPVAPNSERLWSWWPAVISELKELLKNRFSVVFTALLYYARMCFDIFRMSKHVRQDGECNWNEYIHGLVIFLHLFLIEKSLSVCEREQESEKSFFLRAQGCELDCFWPSSHLTFVRSLNHSANYFSPRILKVSCTWWWTNECCRYH